MTTTDCAPDRLLELQLRVARRADALAATFGRPGGLNLGCWLAAEREALRDLAFEGPATSSTPAPLRPQNREPVETAVSHEVSLECPV